MARATRRRHRRHRSAAQRAATRRMLAARRAQLRGVRVKVRGRRRARRHGRARRRRSAPVEVIVNPRRRRSRRRYGRARVHRRSRRSSRGHSRGRRHRRRRTARLYRVRRNRIVRVNPGIGSGFKGLFKSYLGGLTGVMGNFRAATRSGWKGYAAAGAGAVATVFAGTLIARWVMPAAMKAMPSVAASEMGARALSFGCYYTGGWAIARFTPGLKPQTRDALLFGAVAAAIIEVVKPGTIQNLVAKIPGVGESIAGHLSGIEGELSDYVQSALAGLGHAGYEYDGSQGFHDYQVGSARIPVGAMSGKPFYALSDYQVSPMQGIQRGRLSGLGDANDGTDMGSADASTGSGNWSEIRADHDLAGLGCPLDDGSASGG